MIYADAISDPSGATSKDICGTDSSLAVSSESTCAALSNSLEEPEDEDIDLLKSACSTVLGVTISASQHAQVLVQIPVMLAFLAVLLVLV